jgi:DNA-binding transcriptional regulator YhcF (GntR family)
VAATDTAPIAPVTLHWRKQLRASAKPAYLLLADLIADDIRTGRLGARDRLPTLRELAADLQLNYTTVARG